VFLPSGLEPGLAGMAVKPGGDARETIKIPTQAKGGFELGACGFSVGNRKSAIDNFYQSP
jgi:hypothetical protein